jgi:hypothetical protein
MIESSIDYFPLSRMLSKLFLPPSKGAERELVDKIIRKRKGGHFFVWKTRYFKLRTARANWTSPGYAFLPKNLDCFPPYWVMPWKSKKRMPETFLQRQQRLFTFFKLYRKFKELMDSILEKGFNPDTSVIKGDCLVHPEYGEVFVYTDGNQRMGIVSLLAERLGNADFPLPVRVESKVFREEIMYHPVAVEGIKKGYFSRSDVLRWFDHPFEALKLINQNDIIRQTLSNTE